MINNVALMIPNHFIRLFLPKLYRYHFIVPQDKIIETYLE